MMMTKIWMMMMRMTVGDGAFGVDGVMMMRRRRSRWMSRRRRMMRMMVLLRWIMCSMWPEGRMG